MAWHLACLFRIVKELQKEAKMLGWTILFAVVSVGGGVATLAEHSAPFFLKTASLIFAMLFLLSLLTHAVRNRAQR
jgi:hypothetical protein